jgi:VanZ family protein
MQRSVRILSQPRTWFSGYLVWFVTLFLLSSISPDNPDGPQLFPHLDKLLHATYFAAGSALLGIGLCLWRPALTSRSLYWILVMAALVVGGFDEWHQTHTPGRSGNDLGDLSADVVGAAIGFFIVIRLLGFAKGRGLLARLDV